MHECLQLGPIPVDQIDTDIEDQLIQSQADHTQDEIDRKLFLSGKVVSAHKNVFHAEKIVHDDGDGKADHA